MTEVESVATHAGWGQFNIESSAQPVGTLRAQDEPGSGAQLLIAPGAVTDERALAALNRAALALYSGLLMRGLLAPPPPLEVPAIPLIPDEG